MAVSEKLPGIIIEILMQTTSNLLTGPKRVSASRLPLRWVPSEKQMAASNTTETGTRVEYFEKLYTSMADSPNEQLSLASIRMTDADNVTVPYQGL